MDIYKFPSQKNQARIIITDSGLGGVSVQALLDKELRKSKLYLDFEIIFFNALADHDCGYNTMSKKSEKLSVLENAISGMLKLDPDIIFIACNTLSVLYPFTKISSKLSIPVISIVDIGVDMVLQNTKDSDTSGIIIMGTETTITSRIHEKSLMEKGIETNRIITQKCKSLESYIQSDPYSTIVNRLIEKYVDEAANKMRANFDHLFVILACTHYGYSISIFKEKLKNKFGDSVTMLNPNEQMAKHFSPETSTQKSIHYSVKHKVLSKVQISALEIAHLFPLLTHDSVAVAESLKNYTYKPNLFHFIKKDCIKN